MFLRLDPSIRNWVFIPITVITVAINLLMKYLNVVINQGAAKANPSRTTKEQHVGSNSGEDFLNVELKNRDVDIKVRSAINRSAKLRSNFMYISDRGFKLRKAFFCNDGGFFSQKLEQNKAPDVMNPNMMVDVLKKNLINGLYYALIFVGVGYMFSGFILLKLPFGLTQKFRSMMQQGLNLPDVDVSYVSAISWCFILVFGLNSILQHFDGGDNFSMLSQQEQMMKAPMQMMPFGQQGGPEFEKLFSAEKENIEIIPQFSLLEEATDRLLEKYDYILK
jgi:hypothetical protein